VAAELKRALGVDCKLKAGGGGVFNVTVDGKLLFSKKSENRFPDEGEMTRRIRA
jgi:selT/selW/selH-like putative selenoprotein